MKSVITLSFVSAFFFLVACTGNNQSTSGDTALADTANYTTIQWVDSIVNFGTVNQGEQVKLKYRFKNTGNKPLFIVHVRPSCGCTVPEYTKEAIAPGKEGEVIAGFDTNRAAAGNVRKTVTVYTNTNNGSEHNLIFTGDVKEVKVNK